MSRVKLLRIVNILLALVFLSISVSGIIQMLSPGTIPYLQFKQIHPLTGMLLIILVLVHVYLNWNWIKANYLKKKSK